MQFMFGLIPDKTRPLHARLDHARRRRRYPGRITANRGFLSLQNLYLQRHKTDQDQCHRSYSQHSTRTYVIAWEPSCSTIPRPPPPPSQFFCTPLRSPRLLEPLNDGHNLIFLQTQFVWCRRFKGEQRSRKRDLPRRGRPIRTWDPIPLHPLDPAHCCFSFLFLKPRQELDELGHEVR